MEIAKNSPDQSVGPYSEPPDTTIDSVYFPFTMDLTSVCNSSSQKSVRKKEKNKRRGGIFIRQISGDRFFCFCFDSFHLTVSLVSLGCASIKCIGVGVPCTQQFNCMWMRMHFCFGENSFTVTYVLVTGVVVVVAAVCFAFNAFSLYLFLRVALHGHEHIVHPPLYHLTSKSVWCNFIGIVFQRFSIPIESISSKPILGYHVGVRGKLRNGKWQQQHHHHRPPQCTSRGFGSSGKWNWFHLWCFCLSSEHARTSNWNWRQNIMLTNICASKWFLFLHCTSTGSRPLAAPCQRHFCCSATDPLE